MSGQRGRDVVVIGGSAGAFTTLKELVTALPPDLGAAVAITLHRSPNFASKLVELLGLHARMHVVEPEQGDRFEVGTIYVAPRDLHMSIEDGTVTLSRGPKQHHSRPAIDPLFDSAARSYHNRVIGVLLTGNLSDGVNGLINIKSHGGISLVQDPDEAPYPSMPQNALIHDHVDLVFRTDELPELLRSLIHGASLQSLAKTSYARRAS